MIVQIIGFTIPAIIVFLCVWVVLQQQYKNEEKKRLWETRRQTAKEISQLRLRAYERLILLLERTEPEHLLINTDMQNMSVQDLQRHLLRTVRLEFDHNLSQQIYVSDELWDKILLARNEIASFFNTIIQQLPENSTALDYANFLLAAYRNNGTTPHQIAEQSLKEEVRQLLDTHL